MDHPDLRADSDVFYSVNYESINVDTKAGEVTAELNLASTSDGSVA